MIWVGLEKFIELVLVEHSILVCYQQRSVSTILSVVMYCSVDMVDVSLWFQNNLKIQIIYSRSPHDAQIQMRNN
jgi:hypothetical protein